MHREGPASRSGSALLFSIRHDASIFCQSAESRPRRDRPESQREQRANRHIQRGLHQTFHPSQRNSRHARSVLVFFSFSPSRYVWDRIVSQASASNIFILAYSQGGIQAKNLLQSRESEVLRRLRAIALTESSHSLQSELNFGLGSGDSRPIRQFLEQHAINWVASSLPAGQRLQVLLFSLSDAQELEEVLGCLCISAGMGDTSNRAFGINNAIMIAFAFAGAYRQTVLVHASVIMNNNKGYLFLGKSGTGKSTHSRLWLQHIPGSDLLNDDNPAVRVVDGKALVYGTPWSGKTPCYRNLRTEVGAFLRLRQAPENVISRETPVRAFASVLSSCSTMLWDKASYNSICATVEDIIKNVPAYFLACRPDKEAAELSFSTIAR